MPDFDLLLYRVEDFDALDLRNGVVVTGDTLDPISVTVTDDNNAINDIGDPGLSDTSPDLITASSDPALLNERLAVDSGPNQANLSDLLVLVSADPDMDGNNDIAFLAISEINGQSYVVVTASRPFFPDQDYSGSRLVTVESARWSNLGFTVVLCLCNGAMVQTASGAKPVEQLKVGDLVQTRDNGLRPIRWIGCRSMTTAELAANPKLRPVRIMADSLGYGLPEQDLLVSRQHRMLASSPIVQRMFGTDEVLVPAIRLTELPGIYVDDAVSEVQYFHLLLDSHEIIYANGAPTESFLPGDEVKKSLPDQSIEEIREILPEAFDAADQIRKARPEPAAKQARRMVTRHGQNRRALLSAA